MKLENSLNTTFALVFYSIDRTGTVIKFLFMDNSRANPSKGLPDHRS